MICRTVLVMAVTVLSIAAGSAAMVDAVKAKHGAHYYALIVAAVLCDIALWAAIAFLEGV